MPVRRVMIDVDGTLIDGQHNLFPGVKEKLKLWADKYDLECRSHTGGAFAEKILKRYDLLEYFMHEMKVYLPKEDKWVKAMVPQVYDKPDIIVDNDPDSIMRLAGKLVPPPLEGDIKEYTWWTIDDIELFKNSKRG